MVSSSSHSQVPNIEWQKCYGGTSTDKATSICQTTDKGFVLTGHTTSNDGDVIGVHGVGGDYWVVKLDSIGNLQWQTCLGDTMQDIAYSIQQTTDGGFIVAGKTQSNHGQVTGNHGDFDYWVVKLDVSGNIQWQKCLGGTVDDEAYCIQQTNDGGYIVAGWTHSNDGDITGSIGGFDYWIVKLDNSGNIQWQKCLGGTSNDWGYYVNQTTDGGFFVAGYTASNNINVTGNHGNFDYWVLKLDSSGNIIWQKCLGGTNSDYMYYARQNFDGGFILIGSSESNNGDVTGNHGNGDFWAVKLDSVGNIKWQKCLGGSSFDIPNSIQQTSDDGFIIAGATYSNDGDVTGNHGSYDYWVVKLDSSGTLEWQKCLGGTGMEWGQSLKQTNDEGIIVAGYAASNDGDVLGNHGGDDFWVTKLSRGKSLKFFHQISNNSLFSSPTLIGEGYLNSSTAAPFNLCADGSEASFLEYINYDNTIPINNIYFQIKNFSNSNEDGEFLTPSTIGLNTRKATFRHPNYFNSNGIFKEDTIQITNGAGGNIIGEYPLRIYRAPVLMVHGLWSNRNSFNNMYNYLVGSKYMPFNCFKADYSSNDNDARDYFTNRYIIKYNINHTISMCLNEKISAGKVDIVAHSMGGLLSRFYLQSSWFAINSDYRNDIHKLITLNTPHSGSQMANFLLNPDGATYRNALNFIGKKSSLGAVYDLKVNSVAIDSELNLNSLNANLIPSTTIQTEGSSSSLDCSFLGHLISHSLNNSIFNGNPNDLIVEVASQQGGIILNPSLLNECHIGTTGNPINIGLVDALLESDGNSSPFFTTSGFHPPDLNSIYRLSENHFMSSAGTIQITSPSNGQTFAAGTTIPINISGIALSKILLITGSKYIDFFTQDTIGQNATFLYTIPQEAIGDLKIVALGGDTANFDCLDTITININVTATLDSISVYPSPIFIHVGEYTTLDITGYFNDGVSRNLNEISGISYSIANTSVALHDILNTIHGLRIDTTSILISYLGQSLQVPIFVSLPDTNSSVGLNNPISLTNSNKLLVYPNPNNGNCTIVINASADEHVELEMINPIGQKLYNENWDLITGINKKFIDFSYLPNGIYFLIVKSKDSLYRNNIIKN